jgi:DNA mismatch repair ATPase MutL
MVHSQVLSALREAFQRADLSPALRTERAISAPPPEVQDRMRQELASMMRSRLDEPAQSPPAARTVGTNWSGDRGDREFEHAAPTKGTEGDPLHSWRALYGQVPSNDTSAAALAEAASRAQANRTGGVAQPPNAMRPRAIQMHNLYLVVETEEGILIIDQHALHERVIYEQLRERMTGGPLESQRLLLPETLPATSRQVSLIEQQADLLKRLGVEAAPFGTDTVAVHAFPSLLKDADVVSFMRDLLDYLEQQPVHGQTEVVIHRILDMMACKAAVKAGDPLTEAEIETLVRKRHLIDKATSCPHGRPTILRLTKSDLNRQFKR